MDTREIIFEMPLTYGRYRVVCQFGIHYLINYAWWGYLQKQKMVKRWPWSKPMPKWFEVDRCWWSKNIESLEDLRKCAESFYDENVELLPRLTKKAMELK